MYEYYDPSDEGTIIWNDPDIGIDWPIYSQLSLSAKDMSALSTERYINMKLLITGANGQLGRCLIDRGE